MTINFENKNVLVTGGTRGIGAKIAEQFAENGARVTITSTSADSSQLFRKKFPHLPARCLEVDFSNLESTLSFADRISSDSFDILINNAGINKITSFDQIPLGDWQKIQDVNLRAPFIVSQAVSQSMIKNSWGRIINISSVFGVVTKEKRLSYTTSKSGLIGMTKTMALDLAPHNILVNSISPGFIDTELTRNILSPAEIDQIVSQVPLKKLGQPSDVAQLTLFLASPLNQFLTGENIMVDGGFSCG
jgi:3-oxoacyl-[acyl-carrier protein] reductase